MADQVNIKVGSRTTQGMATILAIVVSRTTYKVLGRSIIYGILGWIYVIYYLYARDDRVLF